MATDTTKGGSAKKSSKKGTTKKTASKAAAAKVAETSAAASAAAPAPAPETAKKPARKRTATKKTAAEKAVLPPVPPVVAQPIPAPAVDTPAPASVPAVQETTVLVKADAGYGNTFYLRGTGPGMSWDKGVALQCVTGDEWIWSTSDAVSAFEVKVLLNDEAWQEGENTTVAVGEKCVIEPTF